MSDLCQNTSDWAPSGTNSEHFQIRPPYILARRSQKNNNNTDVKKSQMWPIWHHFARILIWLPTASVAYLRSEIRMVCVIWRHRCPVSRNMTSLTTANTIHLNASWRPFWIFDGHFSIWPNLVHTYRIHFWISFVLCVVFKCQYFWSYSRKKKHFYHLYTYFKGP